MYSTVIRDKTVPICFEEYTNQLLGKLGPDVTYGEGTGTFKYSIRKPVDSIHLLDKGNYDNERKRLKKTEDMAYEPDWNDYEITKGMTNLELVKFYKKMNINIGDTSYGFWTAVEKENGDYDAHIYLCPSRIVQLADRVKPNLADVRNKQTSKIVFQAVILHEMGHHFLLANQTLSGVRQLTEIEFDGIADSRISEGLANNFAYLMGNADTRKALCQIVIDLKQSPSYRLFLFLKHADITALLECFSNPGKYHAAPAALNHVFGPRFNHNGQGMFVNGRYQGVAFDWSGLGGKIVAKDGIWVLTSMLEGCFVASSIDLLVGRFPRNVLIVTNKIDNAPDYERLPSNIIILPKSKFDLSEIIARHLVMPGDHDTIWKILKEIQMDDSWIERFRPRLDEIEDEIKSMDRAIESQ